MEASSTIHAAFFGPCSRHRRWPSWFSTATGGSRSWNPAAQRIFGWSESEVLGQRPPFVPDDKQGEFLAVRERERAGEFLDGVELCRRRKDGTPIDVRLWTAPLRDARGRVTDVVGHAGRRHRPSNARRPHAERAMRSGTPCCRTSRSCSTARRRPATLRGCGSARTSNDSPAFPRAVRRRTVVLGLQTAPGGSGRSLQDDVGGLRKAPFSTWQYRWQCADGTYRWFLDQAYLRRSHGESPQEFVGTWLDITERKTGGDPGPRPTRSGSRPGVDEHPRGGAAVLPGHGV